MSKYSVTGKQQGSCARLGSDDARQTLLVFIRQLKQEMSF